MSDDAVAQFMAITSAEAETAQQYSQAADFNIEQAIESFFASGGASIESQTNPGNGGGNGGAGGFDDDVRERIEGFDDQLVDEEAQLYNEAVRNMRRQEARTRRPRGIFNQNRDEESNDNAMSKHERRLANLFRPPFDSISDISSDEAKQLAQNEGKLVMVNVQDLGEFACQRLNRDIWRSQQVKQVIQSNFVFLQYDAEDPDGEDYRVLYPFESFPHIAIIDPWTGEQQKVWSKVPGHDEFIEDSYDFISSNPVPEIPAEDEEMAAEPSHTSGPALESHQAETVASSIQSAPSEAHKVPEPEPKLVETSTESSPIAAITPDDSPEPAPGPGTTRIQLRYGNGKRVVRRFNSDDKVSVIYGVVKHDSGVNMLTLTSERRDSQTELDKTIEEANSKNSTVLVEFE